MSDVFRISRERNASLLKELWVTMSHVKKDVFRLVASVGQRKKN